MHKANISNHHGNNNLYKWIFFIFANIGDNVLLQRKAYKSRTNSKDAKYECSIENVLYMYSFNAILPILQFSLARV